MTKEIMDKIDNRLLAARIADNPEFVDACTNSDTEKIMDIVNYEIEQNNLHTNGSRKLKADIFRMAEKQTTSTGKQILEFVWNSRLSGNKLKVAH